MRHQMGRRQFIRQSAAGVVGAGALGKTLPGETRIGRDQSESLKIKEYRTLGRTGFKVSDIAAGEHHANIAMLNMLLDAGVNYIDTGESYGNGRDERVIGEAIKNRDRKSLFITTKLALRKDREKSSILERSRKCLERLNTGYVDCMMIHAAQNSETVLEPGFHEAMSQLKAEGRVRYLGLSNHGAQWLNDPEETMEKVMMTAVEDGRFDVVLLAYNFIAREQGERVLRACAEKKIGTTLMKTNPVGLYVYFKQEAEDLIKEGKEIPGYVSKAVERMKVKVDQAQGFLREHQLTTPDEIRDAAIRFVLSNRDVNTACITYNTFDDVKGHLKLSGTGFSSQEMALLDGYSRSCGSLYCRHACGICESVCPQKVPVNTIMRYQHYFAAQGREKHAMMKYAALSSPRADHCFHCEGFCEAACPYGVPAQGLLTLAHKRLVLV